MTNETEPETDEPHELIDLDELLGEDSDASQEELIGALQDLLSSNTPTVEERAEDAIGHVNYEQEVNGDETVEIDEFLVPLSADMVGVETWVDGNVASGEAFKAELFDAARNNGLITAQCEAWAEEREQEQEVRR